MCHVGIVYDDSRIFADRAMNLETAAEMLGDISEQCLYRLHWILSRVGTHIQVSGIQGCQEFGPFIHNHRCFYIRVDPIQAGANGIGINFIHCDLGSASLCRLQVLAST